MELSIQNIVKTFGDNLVLDNVSFNVKGGVALGLLGRNGAGKTTTIRIIMQLFPSDSGSIILDGKPLDTSKVRIGYLPEERGMYPKIKVLTQLIYLGELVGLTADEAKKSAKYWLERTGMTEYENKKLMTLSKGNQQKIQLVSTLLADPEILIFDEPFSGLDPVNALILKEVVQEMIDKGKIVIFSSHQMSYVEEFCKEIAIIHKGVIAVNGKLKDIKREYTRDTLIINTKNYQEVCNFLIANFADKMVGSPTINKVDENVTLKMVSETLKTEFIDAIINSGFDIDGAKVYEPSLNDLFVKYTGESL